MPKLNPAALRRAARHSFEAYQLYIGAQELRAASETLADVSEDEMALLLRAYADRLDVRRRNLMKKPPIG